MFGITPQSTSSSNRHITQNAHEEIRHSATSSTYDNSAAERMKMEYLKKERERREKERNKLLYDEKKREYDRLMQEEDRMKIESQRLETELTKYTHDIEGVKLQEKREIAGVPALKREEIELIQKIQKAESELLQYKNRHQRVIQELTYLEQQDKSTIVDLHKRESYSAGIKAKFDMVKVKNQEITKQVEKLRIEVDRLKRLI